MNPAALTRTQTRGTPAPPPATDRLRFAVAVRLEVAKTRRLRVLPAALLLGLAGGLIASMTLFTATARTATSDPGGDLWPRVLLGGALASAVTGPLLCALLASLLTDVEHTGAGWNLNAGVGLTPGRLLRVKLAVLAGVLGGVVLVQALVPVGIARVLGVQAPLPVGPWAAWVLALWAVDVALCAGHVLLAAVVPNQLVGVGVGLLGSFLAVYLLLAPLWVARLLPWGYYAVVCPAAQDGDSVVLAGVPWSWVAGFLVLVAGLFGAVTRHLDRIETRGIRAGQGAGPRRRRLSAPSRAVGSRPARGGLVGLLAAEGLKTRRGAVGVVALLVPVLAVVTGTVNYAVNQGVLSAGRDVHASQVMVFYSLFFAPIAVGLLASAAWRPEHRGTSWTMVRSTPHRIAVVVLVKTFAVLLAVAVMHVVLLLLTSVVAACLGLGLGTPAVLVEQCLLGVAAAVPLVGLQSLLSMRMRSFSAPVVLCLAQVVVGVALVSKASPLSVAWPAALVTRSLTLGSAAVKSGPLDLAGVSPVLGGALATGALLWGLLALEARRRYS